MKTFTLALVLLSLAIPVAAQTSFPLTLSVGDYGSYGYESPYTSAGIGAEFRHRRVIGTLGTDFSPTAKLDAGDGYSIAFRGALALRSRSLFASGGVSRVDMRTSKWSKTATRYNVSAGFDDDRFLLALGSTVGGDDPNKVRDVSLTIRRTLSRVRIGATIFTSSFEQPIGSGRRQSAMGALAQVDYVFRPASHSSR